MTDLLRAAVRAPASGRALREVLFCLAGVPFALASPVVVFFLVTMGLTLAAPAPRPPNPAWWGILGGLAAAVAVAAALAAGLAAPLGSAIRRLAATLLGDQRDRNDHKDPITAPLRPGGRAAARLADGSGWRATAYLSLKLPVILIEGYVLTVFWVFGLVNLSFPLWWQSMRNHPPGVRLNPVPVFTPFGWFGQGTFHVTTLTGAFAACAAGLGMLLAAPWVTRAVVTADRWLIRTLLGPGRLAQRIQDLERTRSAAVDDAADRLRRLERDLHDGAQIRLATLAMNLGMAKRKLGDDGDVNDPDAVRELVDAALRGARDSLAELRELARGIHPPVLDNGLPDALAGLAADSAIPTELACDLPARPTPAIETIAYFCAAELLANAAKHSQADKIQIHLSERSGALVLAITDSGRGGAAPGRGSGLSGLRQRVATVDGTLAIASPPGGPTRVTVELPMRA